MQVKASPLALDSSPISTPQRSLQTTVSRAGVGLHTGATVNVTLEPAPANFGRVFVRQDLAGQPEIPARVESVRQTLLSTELVQGEAQIRTVEHLLAALVGMGVDNVRLVVDGPEVPLLDGSAREWVEAIAQAGVVTQSAPRIMRQVTEPVWIRDGDAFVAAIPASELRFTYGIDFKLPAIGNQWHSWAPTPEAETSELAFQTAIAPARTFGLLHQIDALREKGLIKGGSLENALVCGPEGWVNPPLRFANEPARHKLLDLVGDLSLLGVIPTAHYLAYKASHSLHTQLARSLS
ncbi:MAG TPA: UDP-3-O-acyl-N-acetylglucosamine deacetylase [Leptolyngbyaceae cyanobacterium M33_DOE_097]|uniref:UDP-3-O-acyl-N-acetylglucosamine deacetylase n=1 Tax=Oscillatoriales cyanobacterium SpSt-418 TaxID=2282169 RepID=A0A7C3KD12_9CYAN|nr:UDP-3-O-acyl-N-acetylglucosamine deacetylase [Leptolyngbyaceae cyanobacterium M33_DOE_097]